MIARLRKRDRQWKWTRWLVLATGFVTAITSAICGYGVHWILSQSFVNLRDSAVLLLLLVLWTKCCLHFFFSIWCFATVSIKWHGDVNRMLLLKLLDAQSNK